MSTAAVLVVDLEATCSDDGSIPKDEMETIEIGAVMVNVATGETDECFSEFVKPVRHPVLTPFCRSLTGIRQFDVHVAEPFPAVFGRFCAWSKRQGMDGFCSWGRFDKRQLEQDCAFHGIAYPFRTHTDLGRLFTRKYRKRRNHRGAMRVMGIKAEGAHHRGLDDARNIAKMVSVLLGGT